ncbi:MAG: CDP-diacylglycerol--glycerol-3-phosphate 3-phosphatidyltransferase [Nitrospirota bacterium]
MNMFNIPNLLSISRILSVPIFIVLLLNPDIVRVLTAVGIFFLASATDWLDGYLARKWGQVTKIGKLLDPIADKILIMSALVILVGMRSDVVLVPAWMAIVIIGREFAVTGLRSIASSEGIVIAAETWGKGKVVAQVTAVIALLLFSCLHDAWLLIVGTAALWIALILSLYSAALYFKTYWNKVN